MRLKKFKGLEKQQDSYLYVWKRQAELISIGLRFVVLFVTDFVIGAL